MAMGLGMAAACGGGSDVPSATLAPVPTTTSVDPYAVPAVVDEAYVNRVLAALDAAVGDVVRLVVRERAVTPEAVTRLEAIYDGEALDLTTRLLRESIARRAARGPEPGDVRTSVRRLLSVANGCVFAEVERDYSAASGLEGRHTEWVVLTPGQRVDPNPTPWVVIYDGFEEGFSAPEGPCDAQA